MLGEGDIALFHKIHPRRGFHIHRWGPDVAARIDRLVRDGLVSWSTDSNYPGKHVKHRVGNEVGVMQSVHRFGGMRLMLTQRGKYVQLCSPKQRNAK